MTKMEILNTIKPLDALYLTLPKEIAVEKADIVSEFFKWNHTIKIGQEQFPIEHGVLIMVLLLSIKFTDGDFNDVYLRMVLETLVEKERIYKTSQAVEYMNDIVEQIRKNNRKNNRVSDGEPFWIDETMNELKEKWNT